MNNLLYQTGYLTIKDVFSLTKSEVNLLQTDDISFSLDFPNQEVKNAFLNALLKSIRQTELTSLEKSLGTKLLDALKNEQWPNFAYIWNLLLAHIPSSLHLSREQYYYSLFILFAVMNGLEIQSEKKTSLGQMDVVVEFLDRIFILEFKLNKSAVKALKQIHDKRCYDIYILKNKPIVLVGITFNSSTKQITDIIIEELGKGKAQKVFKSVAKL